MITDKNKQISQIAYVDGVETGKGMLYNPEIVRAVAGVTQVESKTITKESIKEIVKDIQTGAIVEEVEYDDIEMNIIEDGLEDVIYIGEKTQSIYIPKKNKEKAWRVFWNLARLIKEEEDEEVDFTKGSIDQKEIMFGSGMENDQENKIIASRD